jgi:hypothetical protein
VASPRTGELSARLALLGLLVQQSDTLAGVGVRLEEEHPGARWQRNIVHNSVPSLVKQGFVSVTRRGPERSLDHLEATSKGIEHFRRKLRASSAALPAQRDALRAKLKYIDGEADLGVIIGDIREQEELCVRQGEAAKSRYRTAQRLGRLHPGGEKDWKVRVRRALMVDEVSLWYVRAKGLQRLREHLEDPDGENDTLDAGPRDG